MAMRMWTFSAAGLMAALAGCADNRPTAATVQKTEQAPVAQAVEPAVEESMSPPVMLTDDSWTVLRVAGDMQAKAEFDGKNYRFGQMLINTPLPEGYPAPTPPGAIELKKYPEVRRAQVSRKGVPDAGMNSAFWPLFRHIQRRDIAMTSPVEMDYPGVKATSPDAPDRDYTATSGNWTMAFLYRERDMGPLGPDRGEVEVVDAPAMTVIAIGFRGAYRVERVEEGLYELERWLDENPQWERAGEPRAMYYNGPERRAGLKWGEVQLPVRPRAQGIGAVGAQ